MPRESVIVLAVIHPETLGVYGDRGNALALAHRARARGFACEIVPVRLQDPVPSSADVYLLGGGEDAAMLQSWSRLRTTQSLHQAVDRGAACLGVCAGLQLLGTGFVGFDGQVRDGLGLLDVQCARLTGARAVGEVVTTSVAFPSLGRLTGFENHQGDARLGPTATMLGHVVAGVGNGDGSEGAVQGRVVGTYLHGPVLPRNPALADLLLEWVAGPLDPLTDEAVEALHEERLAAVDDSPPSKS